MGKIKNTIDVLDISSWLFPIKARGFISRSTILSFPLVHKLRSETFQRIQHNLISLGFLFLIRYWVIRQSNNMYWKGNKTVWLYPGKIEV